AFTLPVQGETETGDNNLVGGWVTLTIAGDVNGDFWVNIFDIALMASAYDASREEPAYNPNCDVNGDLIIDILDIVIAAGNYGKKIVPQP
ncbi:MAG: dockerin type I domain-containing protein, partial [Candidatus Bathyarchaeia archaeon]